MNVFAKIRVILAFKNRREPESVHVLADAYWHTLLVVCVLSAIGIMAYNFWEFTDVDRTIAVQPSITAGAGEKLPFEKTKLQAVVDEFAKRKATYELYSTQAPVVVDPSELKKVKPTR